MRQILLLFLLSFTCLSHAQSPSTSLYLTALVPGALGPDRERLITSDAVQVEILGSFGFGLTLLRPQGAPLPLSFAARHGEPLTVRAYENVREFPWGNPMRPRMDLHLSGCEESSGSFQVREIEQDPSLKKLAIDFIQTCRGVPTVAGALRFHSDVQIRLPIQLDRAPADPIDPTPNSIHMSSAQGDYIGQGRNWDMKTGEGLFQVQRDGTGLLINFQGDSQWEFVFAPRAGETLQAGVYSKASRYPFHEQKGTPGLAVTGQGRGCNTLKGSFEVKEIVWRPDNLPEHLAVDFIQYCEETMPPLRGSIRMNSTIPVN